MWLKQLENVEKLFTESPFVVTVVLRKIHFSFIFSEGIIGVCRRLATSQLQFLTTHCRDLPDRETRAHRRGDRARPRRNLLRWRPLTIWPRSFEACNARSQWQRGPDASRCLCYEDDPIAQGRPFTSGLDDEINPSLNPLIRQLVEGARRNCIRPPALCQHERG